MNDVALQAGVSKATVSHVINNTRFVEENTKQRVLNAIAELDYRPNAAARSLTTHRTGIIGMVISDATNLFFSEILMGVEDVVRAKNYGLVVCNTNEVLEYEDHYLNLLLGQRVDGIIAAATSQRWNALAAAKVQHTPVVFVDRAFENLEGPFVGVDNEDGAAMGTRHLIECGHRQIGIVAGLQRLSTMRERVAGFRRAMHEANLSCNEAWVVTSELSISGGKEAVLTLLSQERRPSALFINNNLLGLGTLLALKELGLACPGDISLVSFDDHPWAAVSEPPLTVIRQPARQIGQNAAELLCDLLARTTPKAVRTVLPCELVVRQSVLRVVPEQ
jgi:DNA-binding LacI/PurR family transcriptional regulator